MWCNFRWTGWTSWWHCLRKEWTIEGGRQLPLDHIDEKRKRRGKAEDWSTHGIVIVLLIFLTCQTNCDICYNMDNNQWYQRNSKLCRVKVGPVCNQFAVNKWREQWQCCRVGRTEKKIKKSFSWKFPVVETFALLWITKLHDLNFFHSSLMSTSRFLLIVPGKLWRP